MRRQNVHLMAQARHDPAARLELGRRYLLGIEGLPRHVETGLEYLSRPSVKDGREAAIVIADCLPLQEVVAFLKARLAG